jgi:hypothetical protein
MSDRDSSALQMLGHAVRIGRQRAALSQRSLATISDVSQSGISRLERGRVWGMGAIYLARIVWALRDALPLGGCPHGHQCDYDIGWRQAIANAMSDDQESARHRAIMGLTVYDLLRQTEAPEAVGREPEPADDEDAWQEESSTGRRPEVIW